MMFYIELAISAWRQQMAAAGVKAPEVLDELENHLRDDVDKKVQSGLDLRQAFEAAARQIGLAAPLRLEFKKVEKARRALLAKHLLRLFGVAAGLVLPIATLGYLVIVRLML